MGERLGVSSVRGWGGGPTASSTWISCGADRQCFLLTELSGTVTRACSSCVRALDGTAVCGQCERALCGHCVRACCRCGAVACSLCALVE